MSPIENTARTPTQPVPHQPLSPQSPITPIEHVARPTRCEDDPVHRKPMHRIRSHPPVKIHVIPLGDLRHLRPVRRLAEPLYFLLRRLVLGRRVGELQRRGALAGPRVGPDARGREARRVSRGLRHGGVRLGRERELGGVGVRRMGVGRCGKS